MKKNKKIFIIGSYPPPFGGISVHVQRVTTYLNTSEYILYNTSPNGYTGAVKFYGKTKLLILFSFLFKKFRLIHHHSPDKLVRILLCLIGIFRENIYIHVHGASLEDNFSDNTFSTFLLKKIFRNVNIIADNSRIKSLVVPYNPKSIYEIDAFIPPVYDNQIYNTFVKKIPPPKEKYIISMIGWFAQFRETDLYGFDLALEVLKILRSEHGLDISIIASVNGINDKDLYTRFIATLSEYRLEKYFTLITEDLEEIWPLYLISDIFIRPSISDGSSVALMEALWFETRTIASDAVPRPEGVVLFKNRDIDDLVQKILHEIQTGITQRTERIPKIINKKFKSKLLKDIYKIER